MVVGLQLRSRRHRPASTKQLVKDLEREARLLEQKAAEARAYLGKVRAQAAIDEKVRATRAGSSVGHPL